MTVEDIYLRYGGLPVFTDSRTTGVPGIFFALRGERFDGNDFAAQALSNGAVCAVVDKPEVVADEQYLLVDNVLTALQYYARLHRQKMAVPVLGLTGTNGKTTTKELIKCVLAEKFNTLATEGNLNNQIGVPLTLLRMTPETQFAVVEMGASHPGDIRELCDIALPNYGLITNIGKAHLEGFGGEEGVRKTKKELFDYLEQYGGTAFYNADNPILADIVSRMHLKSVKYGEMAKSTVLSASPFLRMRVCVQGSEFDVRTHLVGVYNAENVMAAICVGIYFGVEPQAIVDAIEAYRPSNSRSQLLQTANNMILLDAYNANPSSMTASLQNFFESFDGESKMVILGDMLELGEASKREHRAIVEMLQSHPEVETVLVGENFAKAAADTAILVFETSDALKQWLTKHSPKGKSILLKGSHSMKMEQLVEML